MILFRGSLVILAAVFLWSAEARAAWWKGNLHTHTLWSDGDDYPEAVCDWYKTNGYHFLALSDHNTFQADQKWIGVTNNKGGRLALEKYKARFGEAWVEERTNQGKLHQVRLKTFAEFGPLFDETNRFLLLPAEEVSDKFRTLPLHVNAINIREMLQPQGGTGVVDVLQRNVRAVLDQRRRTGQPMFPHINHPNFGWGITAEELMLVEGDKFFEVYNGHPAVNNEGDLYHANTERIWDILLTFRLAELGLPPMFGTAVDDAHNYHSRARTLSNPGRGWVMVRSDDLSAAALIAAMERGDFYASSGVTLEDVRTTGSSIEVQIHGEEGVTYRTQFIGTRRGFDRKSDPGARPAGTLAAVTRSYSDEIGSLLSEVHGVKAKYNFAGDEIYVRAKVVSSRLKTNPYAPGETEVAWVQPVVPKRAR